MTRREPEPPRPTFILRWKALRWPAPSLAREPTVLVTGRRQS